jgi:DNA polymerase I
VNKLVIIDGYAILHRAFHALPPLTTRAGEPINAVYGLVSMLLKVLADLKPSHIAVAFDVKAPTFRHKEFAGYQAQRPVAADELTSQVEKARAVIEAFGIPIYQLAGYEADDVIGTLAKQSIRVEELKSRSKKTPALPLSCSSTLMDEVVIVTGDRDILQLVNDKVKVYMPVKGLSDAKLMGVSEVIEKMGVAPELIPDYKALAGDSSDNYPGVPGIGPKGAVGLLKAYGSVGGVYKHLEGVGDSLRDKLKRGEKSAEMSHKLATIVTDVPVEFDFDAMSKWNVASPKVLDLFAEFGFRTLTERVKKVGKEVDSEKQLTLI